MKFIRPLIIFLGVVVLAGVALTVIGLTPSIQRWAVLRSVRGTPGLKLDVARVSAGFSSVSLQGLAVQHDGIDVRLDRLDADYSLWGLLFSHRLEIHRLSATGLVVDASRLKTDTTPGTSAGVPALAPSLLNRIVLPFALVLGDVNIDGHALLPGSPPVAADFKITGGQFAPGQEGLLLLSATLTNPTPDARVAVLNAQVRLRATQTGQKTFSRVDLTAVVDAAGKNLSDKNQLSISADLATAAAGEDYSLSVDTLLNGTAEKALSVHASLPTGGAAYAGQWTLKVRTAQLEPFFLGGALPGLTATGEGQFTFQPSTQAVSLRGKMDAAADHLEVLVPALRAIGAVTLGAQFDVEYAASIARLHTLEVRLAGAQPVLELHASSAAEINLKEHRLQLGPDGPGEVMDLNISGLPLAWVHPFVPQADVSGGLITGHFSVRAEQDRLVVHAVQPLRVAGLTVAQGNQMLLDRADLAIDAEAALTAEDLAVAINSFSLQTPAGDTVQAQAKVVVPLSAGAAVALTASYTADLPRLLAPWIPLGRLKISGETDCTKTGSKVDLHRFQATVTDGADSVLFKTTALRPFTLDLASLKVPLATGGTPDLMQLSLGRIPLAALNLGQAGSVLGGQVELGEFVLATDGDHLTLRAAVPLTLADVSITSDNRPALTGLRLDLRPSVEFDGPAAFKARTGGVTVRNAAGATLATFQADATRSVADGVRGALAFNFEIPILASQPLFAGAQAVTAGRASGEIRAALNHTSQLEARLTLNGLVARDGGQTLPVANLSFQVVTQADGHVSIQVPLLLDRAGLRSDLKLAAELKPVRDGYDVEAKLTGNQVEIADAWSVLGVFMAAAAPTAPTAPVPVVAPPVAKEVADTVASWSRITGSLAVDVKSVTRGVEWSMTGLTARVAVDPQKLSLDKLEAAFGDKGRLTAQGDVRFGRGAMPYQLSATFALDEFDAGALLKALEPGKPPTVEGRFDVKGVFTGDGATLTDTLSRTRGSFDLTSRKGIFRGLQRTSNKISMTSKAVELGASVLGSLFGSQNVTKAAEKVAGSAYFVDQLAQSLGELNYDQFNLKLVRDESLNLNLQEISLVSPDIHFVGQGKVTYVAGKPVLEQPLTATLMMAGRDKIEQLLGKLRLTDGTRDELGYAKIREPVTITGTLAKPDPSAFFTKIATSKLTDWLIPGN